MNYNLSLIDLVEFNEAVNDPMVSDRQIVDFYKFIETNDAQNRIAVSRALVIIENKRKQIFIRPDFLEA